MIARDRIQDRALGSIQPWDQRVPKRRSSGGQGVARTIHLWRANSTPCERSSAGLVEDAVADPTREVDMPARPDMDPCHRRIVEVHADVGGEIARDPFGALEGHSAQVNDGEVRGEGVLPAT